MDRLLPAEPGRIIFTTISVVLAVGVNVNVWTGVQVMLTDGKTCAVGIGVWVGVGVFGRSTTATHSFEKASPE